MRRKHENDAGRWDGMRDGDEQTVELPFGDAVFTLDKGDSSVGIQGGVYASALIVGGVTFTRLALERCRCSTLCHTLANALDDWAAEQ